MTTTAPPRQRPWWVPVAAIAPAMGLMMFDFFLRRGLATSVDVVLGIAALLMLLGAATAWHCLRPEAG